MGMVVRTNVAAMNANRSLGKNNTNVGKSLEKLSSGFRINRAADDASGLAISEKMKAQIKGLEQASSNSQDGISLIQTAEGATQEVHNMLNRMTELATKSANGTIQNDVDREAIQKEVDDLKSEITRISEATDFNGIKLMDGNLAGPCTETKTAGTDAVVEVKGSFSIDLTGVALADGESISVDGTNFLTAAGGNGADAATLAGAVDGSTVTLDGNVYDIADSGGGVVTFTQQTGVDTDIAGTIGPVALTAGTDPTSTAITPIADGVTAAAAGGATTDLDFSGKTGADVIGNTVNIDGETFEFVTDAANVSTGNNAVVITAGSTDAQLATAMESAMDTKGLANSDASVAGTTVTVTTTATGASTQALDATVTGGLNLQIGDTNDSHNHVSVQVDDLSAKGLGIDGAKVDLSNATSAGESIQTIKDAINKVSTNRANLGSMQNRLEYTINNLETTSENMTAANSRIRDTDMAKEMMNYSKNNILTQAAQAMLAQANQQPQAILQLLQ